MARTEEDALRVVQGLLAKAERTDNDAEAETFFAKAQALMAKYAIDEAALRVSRGESAVDTSSIVFERWQYASNDYNAKGRQAILGAAARMAGCRIVLLPGWATMLGGNKTSQWIEFCGRRGDVEYAKLLYTSIFGQAIRSGRREARDRGLSMKSGAYAFVTSYLIGYAQTIEYRMQQYTMPADPTGQALVAQIKTVVDEAYEARYRHSLKPGRSKGVSNYDGYFKGTSDGHSADLSRPGQGRIG